MAASTRKYQKKTLHFHMLSSMSFKQRGILNKQNTVSFLWPLVVVQKLNKTCPTHLLMHMLSLSPCGHHRDLFWNKLSMSPLVLR